MKLKILIILIVTLGYMMVTIVNKAASSPVPYNTPTYTGAPIDGQNPPHAVDIDGKPIPESSAEQPSKPIIFAKDSPNKSYGEFKRTAAFDHNKHTTSLTHSIDGKTLTACVECHHTEQPSAPKGQEYLKRFERKEVLTAQQLETSKEPVKSCRVCHWQDSTPKTAEFPPPMDITYPKETGKAVLKGPLTNMIAYHTNCLECHRVAKKRDPKLKPPTVCGDCHVKKT
ncbi:MAG: cytochrome c3 family protein [Pyrinomonadaceae bacterium]|nr:cytochrome c3 family protein [Pyrinomonadaceae bacterium]